MGDNAEPGDIEQEGRRDLKSVEDLQEENGGDRHEIATMCRKYFPDTEKIAELILSEPIADDNAELSESGR